MDDGDLKPRRLTLPQRLLEVLRLAEGLMPAHNIRDRLNAYENYPKVDNVQVMTALMPLIADDCVEQIARPGERTLYRFLKTQEAGAAPARVAAPPVKRTDAPTHDDHLATVRAALHEHDGKTAAELAQETKLAESIVRARLQKLRDDCDAHTRSGEWPRKWRAGPRPVSVDPLLGKTRKPAEGESQAEPPAAAAPDTPAATPPPLPDEPPREDKAEQPVPFGVDAALDALTSKLRNQVPSLKPIANLAVKTDVLKRLSDLMDPTISRVLDSISADLLEHQATSLKASAARAGQRDSSGL